MQSVFTRVEISFEMKKSTPGEWIFILFLFTFFRPEDPEIYSVSPDSVLMSSALRQGTRKLTVVPPGPLLISSPSG